MDKGSDVTLTIEMPLGGWQAVVRALEAQSQDVEDQAESVRLQSALLLVEDALNDEQEATATLRTQHLCFDAKRLLATSGSPPCRGGCRALPASMRL